MNKWCYIQGNLTVRPTSHGTVSFAIFSLYSIRILNYCTLSYASSPMLKRLFERTPNAPDLLMDSFDDSSDIVQSTANNSHQSRYHDRCLRRICITWGTTHTHISFFSTFHHRFQNTIVNAFANCDLTYEELVVLSSFELPPLLFDFFFFRASSVFSTGFASVRVMKRRVAIKMKKRILDELQIDLVSLHVMNFVVLWL